MYARSRLLPAGSYVRKPRVGESRTRERRKSGRFATTRAGRTTGRTRRESRWPCLVAAIEFPSKRTAVAGLRERTRLVRTVPRLMYSHNKRRVHGDNDNNAAYAIPEHFSAMTYVFPSPLTAVGSKTRRYMRFTVARSVWARGFGVPSSR